MLTTADSDISVILKIGLASLMVTMAAALPLGKCQLHTIELQFGVMFSWL